MTPFIKSVLISAGCWTGLFALSRWKTRNALRIFTYHGVERCVDPILNFDKLQIDPYLFEKHVAWIASRYRTISGTEFLGVIESNSPWPDRAALVTFDDGYANNLEVAAPILKKHGVPAVIFVTTGFVEGSERPWWYEVRRLMTDGGALKMERELVERPHVEQTAEVIKLQSSPGLGPFKFLAPAQLRELKVYGIEIGLHGHRHLACGVEDRDVILQDLQECRQKLLEWGTDPLPVFAYPYGSLPELGHRLQAVGRGHLASDLHSLGIKAALTTSMGINERGQNPFFLKRIDVNGGRDAGNLSAISSGMLK